MENLEVLIVESLKLVQYNVCGIFRYYYNSGVNGKYVWDVCQCGVFGVHHQNFEMSVIGTPKD